MLLTHLQLIFSIPPLLALRFLNHDDDEQDPLLSQPCPRTMLPTQKSAAENKPLTLRCKSVSAIAKPSVTKAAQLLPTATCFSLVGKLKGVLTCAGE